jgi:hypothetical protein
MHKPHGKTPGGNTLTANAHHKDPVMFADQVDEFLQLCGDRIIAPPAGASGYAFLGYDNQTYQVLLNLEPRERVFTLKSGALKSGAALDLLSGKKLATENGAAQITLPAGAGTVIVASE